VVDCQVVDYAQLMEPYSSVLRRLPLGLGVKQGRGVVAGGGVGREVCFYKLWRVGVPGWTR